MPWYTLADYNVDITRYTLADYTSVAAWYALGGDDRYSLADSARYTLADGTRYIIGRLMTPYAGGPTWIR